MPPMDATDTVRKDDDGYEPPRVDSVLTADDLAREVQYAGSQPSQEPDGIAG